MSAGGEDVQGEVTGESRVSVAAAAVSPVCLMIYALY